MSQEKLHKLVCTQVDLTEKVRWLTIWNSSKDRKEEEGFPMPGMNDSELEAYLHKATYWWQITEAACAHLDRLIAKYVKIKIPFEATSLREYIARWRRLTWSSSFFPLRRKLQGTQPRVNLLWR